MSLKDKVALITGVANEIGKEIAETFARAGAKVVVTDSNAAEAEIVSKYIQTKGLQALAVTMDITDEEQIEIGISKAIVAFGGIDILVFNAYTQHIEPIDKLSFAEWKKMLEIHLDAAFLSTRACLKSMYTRGKGGHIIYIGSLYSKEGSSLKAPYVTAKHGLMGLCKVVAKEGAKYNVKANVICPGYIRTAAINTQIENQVKKLSLSEEEVIQKIILKDTVDGQFTTVSEIAEVALFFANTNTNALTGQSLLVTHGWHME